MNANNIDKFENLLKEQSSEEVLSNFLQQQVCNWPLASENYKGLEKVEEKEFEFGAFRIKVQFNPERIRSSAAKVDQKSIASRACFLCLDKLPKEQQGIAAENDFAILVNPFPILPQHFTIPKTKHVDQSFQDNLKAMLKLAKQMKGYTIFYNGPKCGASAPDHMHFQAGSKEFMPVETEYPNLKEKLAEVLIKTSNLEVLAFNNYLRKMITVESSDIQEAVGAAQIFYKEFARLQTEEKEPMLNAICSFVNDKYILYLFPRKLHRPSHYFAEGKEQLLISPASVDFGGVFITPRREDFDKITARDIEDIFHQVCIDEDAFVTLCKNVENKFGFA